MFKMCPKLLKLKGSFQIEKSPGRHYQTGVKVRILNCSLHDFCRLV